LSLVLGPQSSGPWSTVPTAGLKTRLKRSYPRDRGLETEDWGPETED
jgi:hypothetical protein